MRAKIPLIMFVALGLGYLSLSYPTTPKAYADANPTITVNTTNDELNSDGDCSLREAIRAANTNSQVDACPAGSATTTDLIILPAGTYLLSITGSDDTAEKGDFDLLGNVSIQGASSPTTIIDAQGKSAIERVFDVQTDVTVRLSNMTIQGGNNNNYGGGGIRNSGNLTLEKILFIANYSSSNGGGLYNSNTGTASLNMVSFGNNQSASGGAIYNLGMLYLDHSALTFDHGLDGGGLFNLGNATLSDVNIASETAENCGGGIYASGNMTITNTTIRDNEAPTGGGIYASGNMTITNTTIRDNHANAGSGGGIYQGYKMSLTNVTISGNTASGNGGGIYGYSFYATKLINITIAGNSASVGFGVYRDTGNSHLGEILIKNSILSNNALFDGNCAGGITSQGHNIDSGNTCNFNQSGDQFNIIDPKLEPLADNGGFTETHALQNDSLAINAGDDNGCPTTDQRGYLRVGGCDIGAFEYVKRVLLPIILRSY